MYRLVKTLKPARTIFNPNIQKSQCSSSSHVIYLRGGSRAAATSKMERFVIIVNGSILDVAPVLDPPLRLPSPHQIYIVSPEEYFKLFIQKQVLEVVVQNNCFKK